MFALQWVGTQTITVVTILSPAYRGSPIQPASARPPHLPFQPRKSVSTLRIGIRYHHDPVRHHDPGASSRRPAEPRWSRTQRQWSPPPKHRSSSADGPLPPPDASVTISHDHELVGLGQPLRAPHALIAHCRAENWARCPCRPHEAWRAWACPLDASEIAAGAVESGRA
jgi:hypothetical protein